MTEYLKGKNINPISKQELETMLDMLTIIFSADHRKNTFLYKKAQMTFDLLQESKVCFFTLLVKSKLCRC